MSTDIHDRCFRTIRFLRFNWVQNPEVLFNETLQTVGLNSDYLRNDPELFEVFRRQLYRRLNKRHYGLLNFIVPAHFVWQIKIMWKMLKCSPRNKRTYEQIRKIIIVSQLGKRPTHKEISTKLVVEARYKQVKDKGLAYKFCRDLTLLEQENKMLKTLGVLQRTRFTWKKNPIKVLRENLQVAGLQLEVFKEDSILFDTLKYRLGRKFQVEEFYKYHALIGLINQNDFQRQIVTTWEM